MNLKLIRKEFKQSGIFGRLETEDGRLVAHTLERAYPSPANEFMNNDFIPKLPHGVYRCIRGVHRLHDLKPFETFEVMRVPGATGILFHVGNYNKDSEGCILVGQGVMADALVYSRKAFEDFMEKQGTCTEFFLEVV